MFPAIGSNLLLFKEKQKDFLPNPRDYRGYDICFKDNI